MCFFFRLKIIALNFFFKGNFFFSLSQRKCESMLIPLMRKIVCRHFSTHSLLSECQNTIHRTQYYFRQFHFITTFCLTRREDPEKQTSCLFYKTKTRHDFVLKWRSTFMGAWKSRIMRKVYRWTLSLGRINRYTFRNEITKYRIDKCPSALRTR